MSTPQSTSGAELFGASAANRVDALYRTPDVVAQRAAVLAQLQIKPGERVLDIGSGPGLLAQSIAELVGPQGSVLGVDVSASMVAIAAARCHEQAWVRFQEAHAAQLPCDDESVDLVVCTQVLEYVPDVDLALAELKRVLRPGGRFLLMDTDWESCVWASSDDTRMREVIEVWDSHCAHPKLPRTLKRWLSARGLRVDAIDIVPIINHSFNRATYSVGMIDVIAQFVRRSARLPETTVMAWADDLKSFETRPGYFFSLNRYVFSGVRPS